MKILFDHNIPRALRHDLVGHEVVTAREMGWERERNGELLALADASFDVLVTCDRKMAYQQNIERLVTRLSVVVLIAPDNRVPTLRSLAPRILAALATLAPGTYTRIVHPDSRRER